MGGCCVDCWSRTQTVYAISSAEAEYIAICLAAQRTLGVQTLLRELGMPMEITIYSDSQGAMLSAGKPGLLHMRHMELRWLFLKDLVAQKIITLKRVTSENNVADLLTKALGSRDLERLLSLCTWWKRVW